MIWIFMRLSAFLTIVSLCETESNRYNGTIVSLCETESNRYNGTIVSLCGTESNSYNGTIVSLCETESNRYNGTIVSLCGTVSNRYNGCKNRCNKYVYFPSVNECNNLRAIHFGKMDTYYLFS